MSLKPAPAIVRGDPAAAAGLAPRRAATRLVDDVLRRRHPLEERLEAADSPLATLDTRERALARAITGATLRRLGTLRAALAPHLRKPLPAGAGHLDAILLTGAAQILLLGVPDHAAVTLAVAQARASKPTAAFAGLVNALLRNLARDRDAGRLPADDPVRDVPPWLHARRVATYGAEAAAAMAAAERHEPALDITAPDAPALWAMRLDGVLLPTGTIRVRAHGPVPDLPGFAEGAWWVQDAAAALPARLLGPVAGRRVADLCAAPGGKTAQLAAAGAAVVAVDRSAARIARLTENLGRLGLAAETVAADAAEWQSAPFDAILLDAPCSATGTIRRHPDIAWLKTEADIASLAAVQACLLDAAVRLLKPRGVLVYATCSTEPEEGEAQIAALLARMPGLVRWPIVPGEAGIPAEWINAAGELRTLPYFLPAEEPRLAGLDGFFAARLTRP